MDEVIAVRMSSESAEAKMKPETRNNKGDDDGGVEDDMAKIEAGLPQKSDTTVNDDDGDDGPSENDLVIRDGFPALKIPGTKNKPMIEGDEPLPRHKFWSMEEALQFEDPNLLALLQADCETVFTARDKPDGNAYSAGQTFFLPATMKPRCALEALAQSIFFQHVRDLPKGTYNPAQSGANWWTLVMDADDRPISFPSKTNNNNTNSDGNEEDEEDEVGLHFDADYELEEQTTNLLLHPRVATITYLSSYGAPTFILDQKSPPMEDAQKKTLEQGISKAWLSHPRLGKHTAFDGRLLHGAPALYFPSQQQVPSRDESGAEAAPKRAKITKKRYTLLVNVWLNHWVMDAGLLDNEVCTKLQTPWQAPPKDGLEMANLKKGDDDDNVKQLPFRWNPKVDLTIQTSPVKSVSLGPSTVDPAGEDELALCNHNVTIKYNATMDECHQASSVASTVELELKTGTITLHVGDELAEASDEEDE